MKMNRIDELFNSGKKIFSVYFTAGYPKGASVAETILLLQEEGVHMIEIGLPFSDPLADGEIIQESSRQALLNGHSTRRLFGELKEVRTTCHVPLVLMGYLNAALAYGMEALLKEMQGVGLDALILPDLPPEVFESEYSELYSRYGIYPIFLITPASTDKRIRYLDSLSKGFLYVVANSGVTGTTGIRGEFQGGFFRRLVKLNLKNPLVAGFGVSSREDVHFAWEYLDGVISGSAYIRAIGEKGLREGTRSFMRELAIENSIEDRST